MKKQYSSPMLERQDYAVLDVLTASGDALVNDSAVKDWEGDAQ